MKNGFIYTCYKDSQEGGCQWSEHRSDLLSKDYFKDEFLISYASLKKQIPDAKVALWTNIEFENCYGIDHVIYDKNIERRVISKAKALLLSPFENSIYLDTDTIIHKPIINDIFKVLKEFSFACCHGNQNSKGSIFPDFNTGMIGVRHDAYSNSLIKLWIKLYGNSKDFNDQKYFREIYMKNKKAFYTLPFYFMHRHWHFSEYPSQAVISHDHSMCKDTITKNIINHLNDHIS